MPNAYKAMDLCMLHLGAKGRLNSPNFQRRSKGPPRKKKRAKKQKSQNEKEIRCTSTQQGNAWYWCLPCASQMRIAISKSNFGEGGALQ